MIENIVTHCPDCGLLHIDEGEWFERPHKTHLCAGCKHLWRPKDTHTRGVARLPGLYWLKIDDEWEVVRHNVDDWGIETMETGADMAIEYRDPDMLKPENWGPPAVFPGTADRPFDPGLLRREPRLIGALTDAFSDGAKWLADRVTELPPTEALAYGALADELQDEACSHAKALYEHALPSREALRGLCHFAFVAGIEGQDFDVDAQAAIEWLKIVAGYRHEV